MSANNVQGGQCAECHAEIVAAYAQSGMSHSWRSAKTISTTALSLPQVVADRVTGYCYEVIVRDGEVWQIETHPDDPGHRRERRAAHTVGSGHHAIALVAATNDYLTELPVGWFAESGWRMNPGYELKNHRFDRPITSGCVSCHATSAVHQPPTNRFTAIESGIDCSRCHGDANLHVAFWKSPQKETPSAAAQLAHPGRLPADQANDVCLQCHLQGDVSVYSRQSSPLDFRPGQRLLDVRHDFLIVGQTELLGVASHGARMLQSRCYVASDGKLTCIHCHDPHRPADSFSASHFDAKCQTCHQPQNCKRSTTDEARRSDSGCVGCHMPKRPTREGIHLVFTDHAIRRRPPVPARMEPQILAPNAEITLVSAWPSTIPDQATIGAAYVMLHETMGPQLPSLRRGSELLSEAITADPTDNQSRYWLASALLALGRFTEARDQFRQVVTLLPPRVEANYRLALAEEAAGNPQTAIGLYERLLADAPSWPEPHLRLAQLYLARQQPAEASRVLRLLVALQPSASSCATQALAERLAGGTHNQAIARANAAIQLDSRDPAAYVARGALQVVAGHNDQARRDFERAVRLDPHNTAAQQAIRTLNGQR